MHTDHLVDSISCMYTAYIDLAGWATGQTQSRDMDQKFGDGHLSARQVSCATSLRTVEDALCATGSLQCNDRNVISWICPRAVSLAVQLIREPIKRQDGQKRARRSESECGTFDLQHPCLSQCGQPVYIVLCTRALSPAPSSHFNPQEKHVTPSQRTRSSFTSICGP